MCLHVCVYARGYFHVEYHPKCLRWGIYLSPFAPILCGLHDINSAVRALKKKNVYM